MSQSEPTSNISETANSVAPPQNSPQKHWTRKQWFWYAGFPTILLSLFIGGPLEHLLLGWIYFPLRVIPRVSVDWSTAILGLFSTLAFVTGLHATLIWFFRNTSLRSVGDVNWSWRSTIVVALTITLMFAAGTAMVGATHQLIWVLTGRAARPGDEQAKSQRTFGFVTLAFDVAREQARQTQAKNNLKQIGLAAQNLHDLCLFFPPGGTMNESGQLLHGWSIFLAASGHYSTMGIDFTVPWNQPPNDLKYRCALPEYINPSLSGPRFDEQGYGLNHFAGNVHVMQICEVKSDDHNTFAWAVSGRKSNQPFRMSTITDGTSNTLLIGTAAERFKPWGHPANLRDPALGINRDPNGFGGPRNWKGALLLMCDGSVRFVSNDIDPKVIKALGTPAGAEHLEADITKP